MVDCALLNSLQTCATQVLRPCRNFLIELNLFENVLVFKIYGSLFIICLLCSNKELQIHLFRFLEQNLSHFLGSALPLYTAMVVC